MGSLFDVADSVFEYKNIATKPSSAPALSSSYATKTTKVPTLFLLDETLKQIHDSRDKSASASHTASQHATPVPPWKYKSEVRLDQPPLAPSNYNPLRRVFSNTVLQTEPEKNENQSGSCATERGNTTTNARASMEPTNNQSQVYTEPTNAQKADAIARSVLKSLTEDIDAFERQTLSDASTSTPTKFATYIEKKYNQDILASVSPTPFVVLARKKVSNRAEEFRKRAPSPHHNSDSNQSPTVALEDFGNEIRQTLNLFSSKYTEPKDRSGHNQQKPPTAGRTLSIKPSTPASAIETNLSPDQQKMLILEKLMKLPRSQLDRLPKAQRELVDFTKKYQQAVTMPPNKLSQLTPHQQHMVQQLKSKMGNPS
ncbi:Aste57867_23482 [Aphanomyces stellatus]|uniref:Aste57867_23482 protein n=1 Tax=Aphanomyces stellatus TaxID=120398 RepID=A0A485LNV3_9STRA|nr:hypothetical protein As57867_023411 [Aphanomyces stellatus]VFU00127.1 Aste57867_23482 [Aphanomyces stellatus]